MKINRHFPFATMEKFILLVIAGFYLLSLADGQVVRTDGLCIKGGRHKERPSSEVGFRECHQYQSNSCCFANFTNILAAATVTSIDNFHWGRCGNLSSQCEDFMIHIECFYRCSPNAANWEGSFPASISGVPICADFCNDWFAACRNEMSCATNWLRDYNTTASGENFCRNDAQCQTWEQRYSNARNLCNQLWGASFIYTDDPSRCIQLNGTNLVERNANISQQILPTATTGTVATTASAARISLTPLSYIASVLLCMYRLLH